MQDPADIHRRRSIRLKHYDYSQAGVYFVTIYTRERESLFGAILEGRGQLNQYGEIIENEWVETVNVRKNVKLDEYVIMPNHIHGILVITQPVGAIHESPLRMSVRQRRNMTLPKLIGRFKMLSAKRINEKRRTPGRPVWQRNYYEHVVRDEDDLDRIRKYIRENPLKWLDDQYYV